VKSPTTDWVEFQRVSAISNANIMHVSYKQQITYLINYLR